MATKRGRQTKNGREATLVEREKIGKERVLHADRSNQDTRLGRQRERETVFVYASESVEDDSEEELHPHPLLSCSFRTPSPFKSLSSSVLPVRYSRRIFVRMDSPQGGRFKKRVANFCDVRTERERENEKRKRWRIQRGSHEEDAWIHFFLSCILFPHLISFLSCQPLLQEPGEGITGTKRRDSLKDEELYTLPSCTVFCPLRPHLVSQPMSLFPVKVKREGGDESRSRR